MPKAFPFKCDHFPQGHHLFQGHGLSLPIDIWSYPFPTANQIRRQTIKYSTAFRDQFPDIRAPDNTDLDHGRQSDGRHTMATLLRWCGNVQSLMLGMRIHDCCIKGEFDCDVAICGKLIQMYAGCGDIGSAHALFLSSAHSRNTFIWNVMIRAYVHLGQHQMVWVLFHQMLCEGALPDNFTMVCIVTSCSGQALVAEGQRLHARVIVSELLSDHLVMNALLNMYSKCGNLDNVQKTFTDMQLRNAVAWTAVIDTFLQFGYNVNAWQFVSHMQGEGVFPDRVFYLTIISICSESKELFRGRMIHVSILEMGYKSDIFLRTALINMYGSCGALEDSCKVFFQPFEKSVVLWNSFILVFIQCGRDSEATQLFNCMLQEGMLPDRVTFLHGLSACANNADFVEGVKIHILALTSIFGSDVMIETSVVYMYGRCGMLDAAWQAFQQLPKSNAVSWNVMLGILAQQREFLEAFHLFGGMQKQGFLPDKFTFTHILEACGNPAAFIEGEHLHSFIVELGLESDSMVGTALVNMYARCSGIEDAWKMFEKLPKHNVVLWNAIIVAHMQRGNFQDVIHLFVAMLLNETSPDNLTLSNIVDACVSELLLDQAVLMHAYAVECGYDQDVTAGIAIINLYGKLGSVLDAMHVFERLDTRSASSWTSLITLHALSGNYEQALLLHFKMELEGVSPIKATYLVALDACANVFELARSREISLDISKRGLDLDVAVATALVTLAGRFGSLCEVKRIFDSVTKKDVILWTATITSYAQNGHGKEAICLSKAMQESGLSLNHVTFVNILAACSHAALLLEGFSFLASMQWDYGLLPGIDHFDCMIDLVGRAGLLEDAEFLIQEMPFLPRIVSFMAFLNACRCRGDLERGRQVALHVLDVNLESSALYVMLANLSL